MAEQLANETTVVLLYPAIKNQALVRRVFSLLTIDDDDLPTVRHIRVNGPKVAKFKMTADLTLANIRDFVRQVQAGQVRPYVRSQPTKQHHKHFDRLVGSNFRDFWFDQRRSTCVLFFQNYVKCRECKEVGCPHPGVH